MSTFAKVTIKLTSDFGWVFNSATPRLPKLEERFFMLVTAPGCTPVAVDYCLWAGYPGLVAKFETLQRKVS